MVTPVCQSQFSNIEAAALAAGKASAWVLNVQCGWSTPEPRVYRGVPMGCLGLPACMLLSAFLPPSLLPSSLFPLFFLLSLPLFFLSLLPSLPPFLLLSFFLPSFPPASLLCCSPSLASTLRSYQWPQDLSPTATAQMTFYTCERLNIQETAVKLKTSDLTSQPMKLVAAEFWMVVVLLLF